MQSFSVAQNLQRGRCTAVACVNDVYPNRFGTLTISGTKVTSNGENCPSGCTATFQFNNTTNKALQGKQVVFNILNNQKVSFVSTTINSQEKTALCGFFLSYNFSSVFHSCRIRLQTFKHIFASPKDVRISSGSICISNSAATPFNFRKLFRPLYDG